MIIEQVSRPSRLASSSVVAMLLERLSDADPKLRVLAAQAVENAARVLEELGATECDPDQKELFRDAVLEIERIHAMAFGPFRTPHH